MSGVPFRTQRSATPPRTNRPPCRSFAGIATAAVLLATAVTHASAIAGADATASVPDDARRAELIRLVRQDCGSCHGLTLQGGLGPALLPESLADRPASALKATILHGRPGTAMPPWQRFLNDAEAEWIVTNLQKGFPR